MSNECPRCNGTGWIYDKDNSKLPPEVKLNPNGLFPFDQETLQGEFFYAFVTCPDCTKSVPMGIMSDEEKTK